VSRATSAATIRSGQRGCPKFHRLEEGRIVEVSDDERDRFRWNSKDA
jgi:hypothetical protein